MANLNNSTVNHLMDESNKKYDMGLYEHAIQCLIEAWDLLPGDKYPYDESYYINVNYLISPLTYKPLNFFEGEEFN